MSRFVLFLGALLAASPALASVKLYPLPPDIASDHFRVTVNGQAASVAHAAANYYFVNFDLEGTAEISITAPSDDYWSKGVEIEPWRHGIRPRLTGRTITFSIAAPMKLSISRPDDFRATSEMLFLFANAPDTNPPEAGAPDVRYYGPGVYHENVDLQSNQTLYLAGGAVIFGSLNIWSVENVKIRGRGIVVYDGPQNPGDDNGWMHRPNWHVIVMHEARHVEISGITCVVRSRTWMIQMLDSHGIHFDNVKVIGGNPANANQDGFDWLGGGDTTIRDCFVRASDDIFALYGNWLGYQEREITTPGHDVTNITIEDSVLSTSISNVVRVSWPQKIFNSSGFTLRNSDVIHMGMGGCKVPFGLLEIWADPAGKGRHTDYKLENIRLEHWYSLVQLRQSEPAIRNVQFRKIWAMENPPLVPSVLSGDVANVSFAGVKLADHAATGNGDLPLQQETSAAAPAYPTADDAVHAEFAVKASQVKPGKPVEFDAGASRGDIAGYVWSFGDGTSATGKHVRHAFPDAQGTLWDGSGRFRVLLKVMDSHGVTDWAAHPVVVTTSLAPARSVARRRSGLAYRYYQGAWAHLPEFARLKPAEEGVAPNLAAPVRKRGDDYAFVFEGYLKVPRDGGYSFVLLAQDGAQIDVDGKRVAQSAPPLAQVCGSVGNMVQESRGTAGLRKGMHSVRVAYTKTAGPDGFALEWEGPGLQLSPVAASMLFHSASDERPHLP